MAMLSGPMTLATCRKIIASTIQVFCFNFLNHCFAAKEAEDSFLHPVGSSLEQLRGKHSERAFRLWNM